MVFDFSHKGSEVYFHEIQMVFVGVWGERADKCELDESKETHVVARQCAHCRGNPRLSVQAHRLESLPLSKLGEGAHRSGRVWLERCDILSRWMNGIPKYTFILSTKRSIIVPCPQPHPACGPPSPGLERGGIFPARQPIPFNRGIVPQGDSLRSPHQESGLVRNDRYPHARCRAWGLGFTLPVSTGRRARWSPPPRDS